MRTILVVEDDPDIRRNMVEFIESEGYSPLAASNGREALDLLADTPILPSAIILDLTMPVMDGRQFRAIQEMDPRIASIPVILMSAIADIESKRHQLGTTTFIKKPINIDRLSELLKSTIT